MKRRAKIVATLGPATADDAIVTRLLKAGADVVRLNLSHGTTESHRENLRRVRRIAAGLDLQVPVLLDLMGPRFRLGRLEAPRTLRRGERLTLGTAGADLPVDDPGFFRHLEAGERILVDNGLVELTVLARRASSLTVRVLHGGQVSTRKGINLPDSRIPFSISAKDRADIAFAIAEDADFLGASYIGRGRDVDAVRALVRELGGGIPIVAKLERAAALEQIDEIVAASDAVMVARGDLGVEVPLHQVPVLQKRIVAAGRRLGRPVIVATQMLESMMERQRPTRAESSDVANAVLDDADALMLSGETAAGRHPVEAVRTMGRIIGEAEAYRLKQLATASLRPVVDRPEAAAPHGVDGEGRSDEIEIADVVAAAAVHASSKLANSRIVAFSQGGFTAHRLSRYRPSVPTLVFTTDASVARRIQLLWGTVPIRLESEVQHRDDLVEVVERELLIRKLIRPGEKMILLMGHPIAEKPLTNLLRIHRVGRAGRAGAR